MRKDIRHCTGLVGGVGVGFGKLGLPLFRQTLLVMAMWVFVAVAMAVIVVVIVVVVMVITMAMIMAMASQDCEANKVGGQTKGANDKHDFWVANLGRIEKSGNGFKDDGDAERN